MLNRISCLACETNLLSRLQKDFTKKPLDLDNTWSDWSPWSPCSSTCGIGLKTRTRSCHDNLDCVGHSTETFFCRLGRCAGEVFFFMFIWCICVLCYLVLEGFEPSPCNSVGSVVGLKTGSLISGLPSFFSRLDNGHCDSIHSTLTADHCFDNIFLGKQPVAWKNIVRSTGTKEAQGKHGWCIVRRDII